jgi:hypothetical protein
MGWDLGTIAPGQTKSITVAVMFGTNWSCPAILTKDDDIPDGNCVLPEDNIHYTISYDANGHSDTNVLIIDHLPDEVDYNSSEPEGDYNAYERSVTWNIGTVTPESNGIFTIAVNANELAEPCGVIRNFCEIEGDSTYNFAEINPPTPVCFWCPQEGIIYVNDDAGGSDTGMSWKNAYLDLQDALNRARMDCDYEIWVAGGIYWPTQESQTCVLLLRHFLMPEAGRSYLVPTLFCINWS